MRLPTLLMLTACAGKPVGGGETAGDAVSPGAVALKGATLAGGEAVDLEMESGRITRLAPAGDGTVPSSPSVTVHDLSGRWLAPAFIDSHIHLAYLNHASALARGGVVAGVDMAAPLAFLTADPSPLTVKFSGPMVTAVGGYPTQSWGSDGYGLECADASAAEAAVSTLAAAGASLIKLPVTSAPVLDEASLAAAVARAHALGLPVASHALSDEQAAAARAAGADVLAHTPTAALSESTVAAWAGGAVVGTLRAFGGSETTVSNLAALRAAGLTVLYGTDFGNTRTYGVDAEEIALMQQAGMSAAEILDAGTRVPAAFWGFEGLGELAVGARASLLVLSADPLTDPATLGAPEQVWVDGVQQ